MAQSEKRLRAWCLAVFVIVLVAATGLMYEASRRPHPPQADYALALAIADAARAMDELSSTIVVTERFSRIMGKLDKVQEVLGSVKLGDTFVYPLTFSRVEGSYADGNIENNDGVRLTEHHADRLESLVDQLVEHSRTYPKSIDLQVYGYSSELRFQDEAEAMSKKLNLSAANLRAQNVAAKLKNLLDETEIECEVLVRRCAWWSHHSIVRPDFIDSHEFPWQLIEVVGRTVFVRTAGGEPSQPCDRLVEQQ